MARPRFIFLPALLAHCAFAVVSAQQNNTPSREITQPVLYLDSASNGRQLDALQGQQIEIRLGAMQACDPQVSSPAVRFESSALEWPPTPGLAAYTYIFDAANTGDAEVEIRNRCLQADAAERAAFSVTIRVGPPGSSAPVPYAIRTVDQANTPLWTGAWTSLIGKPPEQSFEPRLSKLTAVEIKLYHANPAANAEVTLYLKDTSGKILSVVSKKVSGDNCDSVLFVFPRGGWPVDPGRTYRLEVSDGTGIFGWKYVAGGHGRGVASAPGKPLSGDSPAAFLFRTFGAS
jgi:hypothetical protein